LRLHSFVATAALLAASLAAHADTMFDLNAVFQDGAIGSGGFSLNSATGHIDSLDFTISETNGNKLVFDSSTSQMGQQQSSYSGGTYYTADFSDLTLLFAQSNLVGYAGGELCDYTFDCPTGGGGAVVSFYYAGGLQYVDTASATISVPPVAATPEPSSIALLGALGIAGLMRKRYMGA
jgi:hypothetical protein